MKGTINTKTEYTLVLDEQEATWLREMVQNAIKKDENAYDQQMRYLIWDTLHPSPPDTVALP